jgi:lambda family phage portal protein
MTWLDRAIGWLAPKAGLERARARAALSVVRSYEGATVTRRTSNWRTSNASANAEIQSGISRLRSRSRDLTRNNGYAKRAIAALVGNAVGTGIELGTKNKALLKAFSAWAKECDFYGDHDFFGLQALAARAGFESGDCLIVRVRTKAADAGRSGVPLRIKVLEGDHLDTSVHGPQKDGNFAIAGVEIDREGRRVAYHILRVHPGETAIADLRSTSDRVPAEDVIYHFEKERPGQVFGVPRLAVSIMKLRDLDEYQEAQLVKKKIEACFAAFVATEGDDNAVGTSVETETDADGNTRRVEKLSPGTIIYGRRGEEITFGQPSASPDGTFTADTLHAIAAGIGCTYEQLTGDLSRVNYSSMRGGRAEFKLLVEQYRWLTFVPQVCERLYGWFEEAAYAAGKLRTRDIEHGWTAPRWEYVDPKEDVQADKEELAAGLASLSEKLRARGEDPEAVFKEIAEERAKLAKNGITVDFTAKLAAPANGDGGDTDTNTDKE